MYVVNPQSCAENLVGKFQVLIDNPERTCLIKFRLEIKDKIADFATLFKLATANSQERGEGFSILINSVLRVQTATLLTSTLPGPPGLDFAVFSRLLASIGLWGCGTASRARYEVPTFCFP
jgi:hypothetical protein